MSETRVAFLGLGAIGLPMATHVAARFPGLRVWTRTTAKADEFAASHDAVAASDPAAAAANADVVVTCLPSSVELERIFDGGDGLSRAMESQSLLIDCTSGDPASSRRLAAELAGRGIGFVDAPVSGGVAGAIAGRLTVMCGGSEKDMARATPVLSSFGEKIVHCGPVGAGHTVKAMNQLLLAANIWLTGEAVAACVKAGVDPGVALDVINASSGRSNASQNLFPERVISGAYPRTFRLALLDKDVRIAQGIAEQAGLESELTDILAEIFEAAHRLLGEEADHVEAVKLIERAAGIGLSSPK